MTAWWRWSCKKLTARCSRRLKFSAPLLFPPFSDNASELLEKLIQDYLTDFLMHKHLEHLPRWVSQLVSWLVGHTVDCGPEAYLAQTFSNRTRILRIFRAFANSLSCVFSIYPGEPVRPSLGNTFSHQIFTLLVSLDPHGAFIDHRMLYIFLKLRPIAFRASHLSKIVLKVISEVIFSRFSRAFCIAKCFWLKHANYDISETAPLITKLNSKSKCNWAIK